MNEPIISVWLIYLISVVGRVQNLAIIFTIVSGVIGTIMFINSFHAYGDDEKEQRKRATKVLAVCGAFAMLITLVPSEKTCWQMLVASKVTPAVLQTTSETAANTAKMAMDLITDSVIKILQESEK